MSKTLLKVFNEGEPMAIKELCLGSGRAPGFNPETADIELEHVKSKMVERPGKKHPKAVTQCLGCKKWFTIATDPWEGSVLRQHYR